MMICGIVLRQYRNVTDVMLMAYSQPSIQIDGWLKTVPVDRWSRNHQSWTGERKVYASYHNPPSLLVSSCVFVWWNRGLVMTSRIIRPRAHTATFTTSKWQNKFLQRWPRLYSHFHRATNCRGTRINARKISFHRETRGTLHYRFISSWATVPHASMFWFR